MLQVRLYYVPGAVRYIGEYIYQAVLRQGILGVYKGGKALLRSRTRRPRCTCRSLGAFRALRSRRALWACRTLWAFRALRSRRTLWAFRALRSRRTLWAFRALGAGCSCGSRGTLGSY